MMTIQKSQIEKNRPKLPKFDEKEDDTDAYLFRFEQHAKFMKWKVAERPVALANLLTGQALTVYRGLGPKADEYDTLKLELLRKYCCTQDGFRLKFRQSRPESSEGFSVYVMRIKRLLDRWIEMSGVTALSEDQTFLFLKEQISQSCNKEIVTHIVTRKPATLDELIEIGESFDVTVVKG
jgi:hypothetical protein